MTTAVNPAQSILSEAQQQRFVIEDFRPLSDSLEWDLGQRYLRERGSRAFLSDTSPVPFVINNDGVLSRQAAELFFSGFRMPRSSASTFPCSRRISRTRTSANGLSQRRTAAGFTPGCLGRT